MADYKKLFKTTDNQNWLKVVNAIHITKAGLSDFVTDAAVQLRDKITNDIQQGTNLPAGTQCNKCSTCPEANCGKFRQMIKTYHRFQGPSWRNTNPNDWCTNPWEVAKCYFPGDGYRDKGNAQETDFNGIVGFILNSTTFDGQTGENLSDIRGNKFSKCRQCVNIVRHAATLEVKDADRIDYITQLKDLLKSGSVLQNDKKADEAHGQLLLLENDKLTITADDIVKVIENTLEETKQLIIKANEVNKEASNINANTRDLQTKLETLNDIYKHAVEDIGKQKQDAIKDIERTGEDVIEKIKIAGQMEATRVRLENQDMGMNLNETADEIYKERKRELRQALAQHYLNMQSTMPILPLKTTVDEKLNKFYVPFKMEKVDKKDTQDLNLYKSIFYEGEKSHSNIYIQGEAGIGKSTFCTKLALVWSENVSKEISRKDCSSNKSPVKPKQVKEQGFSDEAIIDEFDFVFSLALRNVKDECEIETMIEKEIINGLPNHTKYAGLVPKVLDEERCLIILDGLDEWLHRRDLCKKYGQVPHRKSWSKTTVLTSTRPWKMKDVNLKDSEISVLIHITGIKDTKTFISNVLKCLNDKCDEPRELTEFFRDPQVGKLEHFLDIPVVAIQLLWLWYSGHDLGNSKCKIYLNMLDMLFGRAQVSQSVCDDNPKTGLPPLFESAQFCKQHKMLLDFLGSLAFHTLCSSKQEESLVFKESIVKSHIKSIASPETALKTALTTGILSQHKSPSLIDESSHFSFLHKSFQEFLAAYYIATHLDESNNIETLFQVYGQTVDIMDISELFIFVCGLNTEMSCKISEPVMKSFSVKLTNHIEGLHVSGGGYNVEGMTISLQKMILAGYSESISNGHQGPQLALHHVCYDRDISGDDKIYRDRLVDRNTDKIVTLSARRCAVDEVLSQILRQSSSTLSHFSLVDVEGLADASLDLFTNITLKSLYLRDINTHFNIKLNTSSLLYCHLRYINKKVEHSVLSALTEAPTLHTLVVHYCEKSVLCQVLPILTTLHRLDVMEVMIPASLCQVLSTLSRLQILTLGGYRCEDPSLLCEALSTLSNLQYIILVNTASNTQQPIELGDNTILLSNSIQEIELCGVKLTCRSVIQLVDRLTQIRHKVTCTLRRCTVIHAPGEELDAIVKHIQHYHMYEIHKKSIDSGHIWLHFTKIQHDLLT